MLKVAVRGGHNAQATGASSSIMNELTEDRKVKDAVIKYLKASGRAEVLDVTPGSCDVNTDLQYGVNKANSWGADLFISCHFDSAGFNPVINGALGHGTWIYSFGGKAETYAIKIRDKIVNDIGFKRRDVKANSHLYELRKTTMPAVIVEVCFVDSKSDVDTYRRAGADAVGKSIAEAIIGRSITVSSTSDNNSNYTHKVNTTRLNVRTMNSTDGLKIGEVYLNERVRVNTQLGDWCEVTYDTSSGTLNKNGWVYSSYLDRI